MTKGHFTHETESPWPLHFKHSHWWKMRSRSKFASHYARGTNGVCMWLQDGCKLYMDSYMASNGSCFMVTWIAFKNQLLEVGLTQKRETMAVQMLTTVDLFDFIICENPHEQKIVEIAFNRGPGHIRLHTTLEGLWPHYMILEVSWDDPLDTFFWALSTLPWPHSSHVVGPLVWWKKMHRLV